MSVINIERIKTKKKIFIITQSQVVDTIGGAITIFFDFCNMLQKHKYDVTGLCYATKNHRPTLLNDKCKFVNLRYYYSNKTYSEAINQYLEDYKPDLLIFFFRDWLENASLNKINNSIPKILMFHSRPDVYCFWSNKIINPKDYNNTTLQILFDSYKSLIPNELKSHNIITIPNYAKEQSVIADLSIEKKKIIYLSRIDCWKGLEFLIKSYATIAKKHSDWELHIYGQSQPPEYVNRLKAQVKRLKLDKHLVFKGITSTPIETLKNYDFCVFPSYFEGFPMGLIEAQSVGLPCIGLEGCSGVNELIIDGYNGFLTEENPEKYGKKIEKLICDKNLRIKFGANSIKNAKIYNESDVYNCWLNAIENILKGKIPKSFDKYPQQKKVYKLFPLSKIQKMSKVTPKIKWYQYLFSIKNSNDKKHKKITILGIKIFFKRREQNA